MKRGEAKEFSRSVRRIVGYSRPLLAIALALMVGAGLIAAWGVNPLRAYAAMIEGAFGSTAALANTGVRTTPLLLGGVGVALAYKAGLLNVGVEGQIYIGGAAAVAVGLIPLPVPAWMHLSLAVVAGFLGGMVWGLIPAYLRSFRGVSEIVTTLMLNYVAIHLTSYLVQQYGPMGEQGAFFPQSPLISPSARLPILIPGTSLHSGILIGLVLGGVLYFVLRYTAFGFSTRMVGANSEAARFAGVNVMWQIFLVLLLSAGVGGLAGTGEVLGLKLRLYDRFSGGLGYDALGVALLANGDPVGVILSAIFFGALRAGAGRMQTAVGIKTAIASVIEGLAVLFVIGIGFARSRNVFREDAEGGETATGETVVGRTD